MKIDLVTLQYVQLEMHWIKFLFFQITQTFRNLLNYASDAPFCLTCFRTFVHNVPSYFRAYTSYTLSCLRALRALFTHLIYTPCAPKNLLAWISILTKNFYFQRTIKGTTSGAVFMWVKKQPWNTFFFYLSVFSRTFTIHGTAWEGGGYLFNSSLPLPPAS